jgi:hypothetical protein
MHKLGIVAFGLGLLGACGGSSPPSIDDVPSFVLNAECSIQVSCNETPDEATCKSSQQLNDIQSETIIADVKAGIIKYNGDALQSCIDQITAAGCDFTGFHGPDNNPCITYLTGTVAAGGACLVDQDCVGNGNCTPTMSGCDPNTTCCPGTCTASTDTTKGAIGATCTNSNGCTSTAYCKGATQTAPGMCAALIATAGAACDATDACANPMVCNQSQVGTGAGTCAAPGATGATCDPTVFIPCIDERDYCDATMKCSPRVAVGAACSDTILCEGLADCVNAKCVAQGTAGATCDTSAGPNCLGGLDCTNSKCTLPAAGNSCR